MHNVLHPEIIASCMLNFYCFGSNSQGLESWCAPNMWILAFVSCMCSFGNLNFCGCFSEIWKSLDWKDFPCCSVLDLLPSPEPGILSWRGQVSSPFSGESLRMFFILIDFVEPHLPSQGFLQSRYKTNYDQRFYFCCVF